MSTIEINGTEHEGTIATTRPIAGWVRPGGELVARLRSGSPLLRCTKIECEWTDAAGVVQRGSFHPAMLVVSAVDPLDESPAAPPGTDCNGCSTSSGTNEATPDESVESEPSTILVNGVPHEGSIAFEIARRVVP